MLRSAWFSWPRPALLWNGTYDPRISRGAEQFAGSQRTAVLHGEAQRLLTASFFHLSASHFLANSAGLLFVGGYLEFRVGTPRFVVIALSSAAGSILGSVLIQYVPWVAETSGLNYGLYGALTALIVRYWNDWDFDYPVPRWLAIVGHNRASSRVPWRMRFDALPAFAISITPIIGPRFLVGALATAFVTRDCPARSLRQDDRGITWIAIVLVMLFLIAFLVQAWHLWIVKG